MATKCGNCANLELDNKEKYSSVDRYWCKEGHGYRRLTDTCPNDYDFIYNPNSNKDDDGYKPSGCYITTIICRILGYDDNCELLNLLRNFRENILKPNKEYLTLLVAYDTYGPQICDKLIASKESHQIAINLLYNYLLPCFELIKTHNFELAINKYQTMVNLLMRMFNIEYNPITINYSDIDIDTLGKGRRRLVTA